MLLYRRSSPWFLTVVLHDGSVESRTCYFMAMGDEILIFGKDT
jgi:hypothetical protein